MAVDGAHRRDPGGDHGAPVRPTRNGSSRPDRGDLQRIARRGDLDVLELSDGRVFERYSTRPAHRRAATSGRVWSFRDITASRRSEEMLREESRILELLNRTGAMLSSKLDLQALVQAVTDAATELSGAKFGAFFYNTTDARGDSFMLYALTGARREDFDGFGQPRATALFGPTFRGEAPIRCGDVLGDPRYGRMLPHRGMPAGHVPVRSYLAVPVISRSGEVIGGLFFGHPSPDVFSERAERLVVGIAAQAAVAIDNARLFETVQQAAEERKQLLESERFARAEARPRQPDEGRVPRDPLSRIPNAAQRDPWLVTIAVAQGAKAPPEIGQGLDAHPRNSRAQRRSSRFCST